MSNSETAKPRFYRPPMRKRGIVIQTSSDPIAFAYAFIISFVCNFSPKLGPIAAAIILGAGLSSLFLFPKMILTNPLAKWALAIPALSVLSILWSQHPGNTAYYSFQLLLTVVVGVVMASFPNPQPVMKGFFFSFFIFGALSLVFGSYVPWEDEGYVFAGLTGSKNAYGQLNFYVVFLGVYAVHYGLVSARILYCVLGAASILIGFAGILMAKASGALVSAAIGIMLYLAFTRISKIGVNSRFVLVILGVVFASLLGLVISTVWNELYRSTLEYFGKDPGLTGRIDLWRVADAIIARNYWFGVGHFAFWVQNDPLPEAIWAEMGIASRMGFNFHNSFRELMVHFGLVGTIPYLAIILYFFLRLMRSAIFAPRMETIVFAVVIISIFTRITFEAVFPMAPVSPDTIFVITALAGRPAMKTLRNSSQKVRQLDAS